MPIWAWILFYALVIVMLYADLKLFGRKGQHEVSIGEALKMTVVWIIVSLIFCGGIWHYEGSGKAMEFLAGYLIEKSLSMDNLFVFLMLFSFFGVQRKYQHEVLFWGIFGALILRSIFIFAGAAMVQRFEWILAIFGVFLIYTGIKMFSHKDDESVDPSKNIFVKLFKKFFPVTDQMHEDKFFIIENGKQLATPLFIALLVIETTDVAFAVDSIPAVFSVSRDPFIVLTSCRLHPRRFLREPRSVYCAHLQHLRHLGTACPLFRSRSYCQIFRISEIRPRHHPQLRRCKNVDGGFRFRKSTYRDFTLNYLWSISIIDGTLCYTFAK